MNPLLTIIELEALIQFKKIMFHNFIIQFKNFQANQENVYSSLNPSLTGKGLNHVNK